MRAVRSRDTKPELAVRRLLHGMGYRYRLHPKNLPGKPDIVFPGRQKASSYMAVSGMTTIVRVEFVRLKRMPITGDKSGGETKIETQRTSPI